MTKIPIRAEKARKFLKGKAFFQSKSEKNSEKGRENKEIKGKPEFFISLKVTKIPERAEKVRKFLKGKAFFSLKVTKILIRAEKT